MRYVGIGVAVLVAVLIGSGVSPRPADAHRVNVFAYVEGDTVHVECSYRKSDRVRFGDIEVSDPTTGKVYLTGKTDEQGNFVFQVPAEARAAKADLRILLRAGEGHQNDWTITADEYLAGSPTAPTAPAQRSETGAPAAPKAASAAPAAAKTSSAAPVDMAALQATIQAAVEAGVEKKIAPIRKILLDEKEKGPGLTEVFGGIGYLLGIAGLLAYARSRSGRSGS